MKCWLRYSSEKMLRSGVRLYTARSVLAVPSTFSSTMPTSQETSPPADE